MFKLVGGSKPDNNARGINNTNNNVNDTVNANEMDAIVKRTQGNDGDLVYSSTFKNKFDKDKLSLNLISATEQIVQSRQLSDFNYKELQKRFQHSQNQIDIFQKEIIQLNKNIADKDKQLASSESKLTEKNVSIDQLMEDYNYMQSSLKEEISGLKYSVDMEQKKYQNLQELSEKQNIELSKKLNKNGEIRLELETEIENIKELYSSVKKDNMYLLSQVNDFANRLSTNFPNFSNKEKNKEKDKEGINE